MSLSPENNLRRYMKPCSICKQHEKKAHKICVQNFTKLFCCVEAIRGIFATTFPRICGQFLKCPRCLDQLSHLWNVFQKNVFFLLNKEMSEQKMKICDIWGFFLWNESLYNVAICCLVVNVYFPFLSILMRRTVLSHGCN